MRLKELRIKNKLKQEQIANKMNMTQEKYSRLENGISKLDTDMLIDFANFYNVSLDYLCDRQWNNQIGYIQDDRRETVKQIINLNDKSFDLVKSYTQAVIDMNEKK